MYLVQLIHDPHLALPHPSSPALALPRRLQTIRQTAEELGVVTVCILVYICIYRVQGSGYICIYRVQGSGFRA